MFIKLYNIFAFAAQVLEQRLEQGRRANESGFILDGLPRTAAQAARLQESLKVDLAVNLSLREEVLVAKCMGRRICSKCSKNWNIADIYLPAAPGQPEIVMPPLNPPEKCMPFMEQRADDTEEVIKKRLQVRVDGTRCHQ